MRLFVGVLLCLLSVGAYAQTCAAPPPDPVPRDAVRLTWPAVTTWVQGGNIPAPPPPVTYSVYEVLSGGTQTKRCETTALGAGLSGLSVGAHTWMVNAKHPAGVPSNVEGPFSPTATKTIQPAPLTPSAPLTLTVDLQLTGSITINVPAVVAQPTPNP